MAENELKVLLLEDNPGDAFLLKFYLSESASPTFTVSHAETLKGALDLLAESEFDIIISDMNLPDSFGVDTIKTILSQFPGNMLIVLTGLTDEDVGLETVRYGAQDFLVKGKFDGKVLISSVMFAFERFKLNSQIDEENNRLDMMQKILGIGYVEVDLDADKVLMSDYALSISNPPEGHGNETLLDDKLALFENKEALVEVIQAAKAGPVKGTVVLNRKMDGRQYEVTYLSEGRRLYGVLKAL